MSVTFWNKGNNKITELRDTRLHLGLMGDLKKCGGDCYLKKKIDLLMQKNPPEMVNNSTNFNKMDNHLSSEISEHKKNNDIWR